MENLGSFIIGYIVVVIGLYLFYAYCNFLLSKKLDVNYPWMAFVPGLHLVNLLWLGGKTFWWGVKWISSLILLFILNGIIQMMNTIGFIDNSSLADTLTNIFAVIIIMLLLYIWIVIYQGISKRTGHGKWWTVGLFFASWLFFPVTAFHYEKGDETTPRPFTGVKKFFLVLFAALFPILLSLGILAAALKSATMGYMDSAKDSGRMANIRLVSVGLASYFINNAQYPAMPNSGCIPMDELDQYIGGRIIKDPAKMLTPGCDGSDGQTYAYRTGTGEDISATPYVVVGAKLEGRNRGNSSQTIDEIGPNSPLILGSGNMYYVVQ